MGKLAIATAVGAAALLGGPAANADNPLKTTNTISGTSQASDFSAHRRYRHYGYPQRRVYRSYGNYAPRRVYYAQPYYAQPYYGYGSGYGYGYGSPGISFGFGGFGGHHGGFGGGFGHHGGGHH